MEIAGGVEIDMMTVVTLEQAQGTVEPVLQVQGDIAQRNKDPMWVTSEAAQ